MGSRQDVTITVTWSCARSKGPVLYFDEPSLVGEKLEFVIVPIELSDDQKETADESCKEEKATYLLVPVDATQTELETARIVSLSPSAPTEN